MRPLFSIDTSMNPDQAVTKTAQFNGTALDLGAGWAPDPGKAMGCHISVTASDAVDGNETYVFTIEESSDNSTFTSTGVTITCARGVLGLFGGIFMSTKRYVRANLAVGGTTPSLTYSSFFGSAV